MIANIYMNIKCIEIYVFLLQKKTLQVNITSLLEDAYYFINFRCANII